MVGVRARNERSKGGNVPLRRGAAVVGELVRLGSGAVQAVVVEVRGQDLTRAVKLGAGGLVVARQDHVGHLGRDRGHPLLPEIPVGLVQGRHVAASGRALGGDLALRQRRLVLGRDAAGQLGAGAVVADGPAARAGDDAAVPVVGVADVAAVPGKGHTFVNSLVQLLIGTGGVGVAHVVEDADAEALLATGGAGRLEAQDVGGSRAVGGRNLIVVGRIGLQVLDLDVVVVLAALGDGDLGARRRAGIADRRS